MIQLHMPKGLLKEMDRLEYEPTLKQTLLNNKDFSPFPWIWHARQKEIYGRNCWVFIEETSLYTLCFFDLTSREIKNIDITLWFRFLNEIQFVSQLDRSIEGVNDPDSLGLIRSWMSPMKVSHGIKRSISLHATKVFDLMQYFLQRPLPVPIPLHYEIHFDWLLNTNKLFNFPDTIHSICPGTFKSLQEDLEMADFVLEDLLVSSLTTPNSIFFKHLSMYSQWTHDKVVKLFKA